MYWKGNRNKAMDREPVLNRSIIRKASARLQFPRQRGTSRHAFSSAYDINIRFSCMFGIVHRPGRIPRGTDPATWSRVGHSRCSMTKTMMTGAGLATPNNHDARHLNRPLAAQVLTSLRGPPATGA